MWRKFTVYGLRFSKTSFWSRMNTGFLDPAVATVPTACGIETFLFRGNRSSNQAGCNSAYRLRYWNNTDEIATPPNWFFELQQCLPLAVLKHAKTHTLALTVFDCVATVPTACGIETIHHLLAGWYHPYQWRCNSAYRLRYWNWNFACNQTNRFE